VLAAWVAALALIALPASADWTLNNGQSNLSFISVKKGDVAEVHRFDQLNGSVDGTGNVELTIQLASVNTAIPIRDERMREMLFNTKAFPSADLTGKIDISEIIKLGVGGIIVSTLQGELTLHGQSRPVTTELVVARLAAHKLLVSSRKPLVLQADDYDLLAGVEKLREVAGLSSISKAVPVSFVLVFDQK
jgi:polyisoprenoid-binding protein YceI